jgi:hypothetical protein
VMNSYGDTIARCKALCCMAAVKAMSNSQRFRACAVVACVGGSCLPVELENERQLWISVDTVLDVHI